MRPEKKAGLASLSIQIVFKFDSSPCLLRAAWTLALANNGEQNAKEQTWKLRARLNSKGEQQQFLMLSCHHCFITPFP